MRKVVVIGGGASGLIASYFSALNGNDVVLLEKNEKLGKKIYITGKGRCNLTNNCDVKEYIENVVTNPKFMYGSVSAFSPKDVIEFFEQKGLTLKTERGNRVFPASDKASDVTACLTKCLKNVNVDVKLNTNVLKIAKINDNFVVKTSDVDYFADSVIVCTGGISYSLTGSTGDGYKFAKNMGHTIVEPKPSLVGINCKQNFCSKLSGLSLKNVVLTVKVQEKTIFSELGEMLFTHFGVSGPLVLSASALINKRNLGDVKLFIDLKSGMDFQMLENRILREFTSNNLKTILTVMKSLLPASLAEVFLQTISLSKDKICAEITVKERERIIKALKSFEITPISLRPIEEAIVTSGGVDVKEVNPKTMESKLVKGLYFAGEVTDYDGPCGGYNLQYAWETGIKAGKAMANDL
jgi:predicted Rossmann fold flavoprotein